MVSCPVCQQDVDWVTLIQAARLMKVSPPRVQQLIKAGRLPGAIKFQPSSNMRAFWKIPIDSLTALIQSRRQHESVQN